MQRETPAQLQIKPSDSMSVRSVSADAPASRK